MEPVKDTEAEPLCQLGPACTSLLCDDKLPGQAIELVRDDVELELSNISNVRWERWSFSINLFRLIVVTVISAVVA